MAPGREAIVRAALDLLDEVGLTLRRLAAEPDVRAPAIYWHVKNKAEPPEAMAAAIFADALAGQESPRRGESWVEWLAGTAHRLPAAVLSHRDGARVSGLRLSRFG
ncbi:TetR family transcriptional regulator [Saccharothrix hoggarensis]|uniref:TetR family transcriptional regulator n=1 Tax=Saccharothrix hoggarensis TaxID=913853 RepID=A0ABW3QUQ8_9PSEU